MALTKVANTLLDFTGGFVAGNVSFPAITTVGDTNTGIYFPAADTIAFAEGGAECARFDSSGNFGIGTASPSASNTSGASFVPGTSTVASMTGSNGSGQLLLGNNGGGSNLVANDSCGMIAFKGRFNSTFAGGNDIASIIGTYTGNGTTRTGVIRFLTIDNGTEAERARFNSTGAFVFAGGTTTANGIGITFPATQSASTDANTLDDYEEGTFTPTIANFTVSGTTTLTGAYTKIGRMVFVSIKFENTGTIAHSTSAFITLPFAIPTGALPTGGIVMYVNNNSESFTSGKNGTQHALDTEGGARFFPGSFTTTSAGQHLFFSGFYRTS